MGKLSFFGQYHEKITLWKVTMEQYQPDIIICQHITRNTIGI